MLYICLDSKKQKRRRSYRYCFRARGRAKNKSHERGRGCGMEVGGQSPAVLCEDRRNDQIASSSDSLTRPDDVLHCSPILILLILPFAANGLPTARPRGR